MMEIPEGYHFTDEHEWARQEDDGTISVGISWHAQDLLGDIVFVELPEEGAEFDVGDEFGVVESFKAASDIYAPVSGEVVAVNDSLDDAPETLNESPFDGGWLIRVKPANAADLDALMDADGYADYVSEAQ